MPWTLWELSNYHRSIHMIWSALRESTCEFWQIAAPGLWCTLRGVGVNLVDALNGHYVRMGAWQTRDGKYYMYRHIALTWVREALMRIEQEILEFRYGPVNWQREGF